MGKNKAFFKKYLPVYAIVAFAVAFVSAGIFIAVRSSTPLAEWVSTYIGHPVRLVLAKAFSFLPFSLAEIIIALSPIIVTLIIVAAVRRKTAAARIKFLVSLLSALSLVFSVYVYTLGVGYHRESLGKRMEIESVEVTKENLISTLQILKGECEALLPYVEFADTGSSEYDKTAKELSAEICTAYERLAEDYPEMKLELFTSNAKPVMASELMTDLRLLGVYSFFTGESNVNVHYPDYTLPFTIAHEFAHQRGISRENEANFIAFAVCIRAEDPYIRYSGYMNMIEYVASALAKTDRDSLTQFYSGLHSSLIGEMNAYRDFYYANKNETLGNLSDAVNDNYLKLQGTEGIVSYGLVVRLAVAYYSN